MLGWNRMSIIQLVCSSSHSHLSFIQVKSESENFCLSNSNILRVNQEEKRVSEWWIKFPFPLIKHTINTVSSQQSLGRNCYTQEVSRKKGKSNEISSLIGCYRGKIWLCMRCVCDVWCWDVWDARLCELERIFLIFPSLYPSLSISFVFCNNTKVNIFHFVLSSTKEKHSHGIILRIFWMDVCNILDTCTRDAPLYYDAKNKIKFKIYVNNFAFTFSFLSWSFLLSSNEIPKENGLKSVYEFVPYRMKNSSTNPSHY